MSGLREGMLPDCAGDKVRRYDHTMSTLQIVHFFEFQYDESAAVRSAFTAVFKQSQENRITYYRPSNKGQPVPGAATMMPG